MSSRADGEELRNEGCAAPLRPWQAAWRRSCGQRAWWCFLSAWTMRGGSSKGVGPAEGAREGGSCLTWCRDALASVFASVRWRWMTP